MTWKKISFWGGWGGGDGPLCCLLSSLTWENQWQHWFRELYIISVDVCIFRVRKAHFQWRRGWGQQMHQKDFLWIIAQGFVQWIWHLLVQLMVRVYHTVSDFIPYFLCWVAKFLLLQVHKNNIPILKKIDHEVAGFKHLFSKLKLFKMLQVYHVRVSILRLMLRIMALHPQILQEQIDL